MTEKAHQSTPTLTMENLRELAPSAVERHGVSVYREVLVIWDEDHDPRVLTFIDELDRRARSSLLAAYESEGCLRLLWEEVPVDFKWRDSYVSVCGDEWSVRSYLYDGACVLRPKQGLTDCENCSDSARIEEEGFAEEIMHMIEEAGGVEKCHKRLVQDVVKYRQEKDLLEERLRSLEVSLQNAEDAVDRRNRTTEEPTT